MLKTENKTKSGEKDINKLSIEFWIRIRNTIKEEKFKPLLKESIKNLKDKNNIFFSNYYNIYSYLILEKCENLEFITKCFSELKILEKTFPEDFLIKYNLLNYFYFFEKNQKVKNLLEDVKNYFGDINCVEFGKILIEENLQNKFQTEKFVDFIRKFPNFQKGYLKTIFCLIKENKIFKAEKIFVEFLNNFENFDLETKINILSFNQIFKVNKEKILKIEKEFESSRLFKNSKNYHLYEIFKFNKIIKKINSKENLNKINILKIINDLNNIFKTSKNQNLKFLSILNILEISEKNDLNTENFHFLKIFTKLYQDKIEINSEKEKLEDYYKHNNLEKGNEISLDLIKCENSSKSSDSNLEMQFFESDNELLDTVDFDLNQNFESELNFEKQKKLMILKKKENNFSIELVNDYYENLISFVMEDLKNKFCLNLEKIKNSFTKSLSGLYSSNYKNTYESLEKSILINQKKNNPEENLDLYLKMAYLDLKENDTNSFKNKLLEIYKKNPNFKSNLVTFSLANLFYMEKNYNTSLFFFSKNYKISDENKITSLLYIGKIFDKLNKKKQSMITYKKLNTSFPNQIFGHYRLAKNLYFEKKYHKAKIFFKICIDKDEDHFKSKTYLGIIGIKIGTDIPEEVKKILFYFSTALENPEINGKFEFLIKYNFSIFYEKIENYDMAIKYKEQAITYKQNDINLANELVKLYIKKNLLKKAIKIYKKFIKFDPENLYVASQLGSLYAYFLDYKKSEKYFLYIKKKDKKNFKANITLGKIYREKFIGIN